MYFIEVRFKCEADFIDILIAELSQSGFDSFVENEDGFNGYIESDKLDESSINEIVQGYSNLVQISFEFSKLEKKNWNEEWEKYYDPIFIEDQCVVRASFHDIKGKYKHEIIINPKMSFGTGHHETTYLMIRNQLEIDHLDKKVYDVGCGTGILAIMASRLGAADIYACDIDEWAVTNSRENFEANDCSVIKLKQGDVSSFSTSFDIILANINRNVLLNDIPSYATMLNDPGILILSGFYVEDIPVIEKKAINSGLHLSNQSTRNNWASLIFTK
ncbi:50S ribosomal protein L11 methyltransferase [Fulvivirgaceae bacterium BMA10]|uniref:Ribosomal protein L11 methyltransferase n=1 Tax=Splendidivirga corallicola TaxID=3051826 RepID=A0ABT8KUH2_9BACT|nr:50S ribosomal protein L11 methyltransferase [Fulvivirgaceae bacterium BMA10]